ncbi:hypothetical protein ACLB2K_046003 [Fragaria x ananassa]
MAGVNTTLPRWGPEEDLQLCKSWRFISQDSRKGKDQKKAELWDNVRKHYENLPKMNPSTMSPGPRKDYWLAKQKAIAKTQANLSGSFPGYPQPSFPGGYPQTPFVGGYPQTPYPCGCYQPSFPGYYYPQPPFTDESTNPIDGNDPSTPISFVINLDN